MFHVKEILVNQVYVGLSQHILAKERGGEGRVFEVEKIWTSYIVQRLRKTNDPPLINIYLNHLSTKCDGKEKQKCMRF